MLGGDLERRVVTVTKFNVLNFNYSHRSCFVAFGVIRHNLKYPSNLPSITTLKPGDSLSRGKKNYTRRREILGFWRVFFFHAVYLNSTLQKVILRESKGMPVIIISRLLCIYVQQSREANKLPQSSHKKLKTRLTAITKDLSSSRKPIRPKFKSGKEVAISPTTTIHIYPYEVKKVKRTMHQ
jgi:hypothetical protein